MIAQSKPVAPPVPTDGTLSNFSGIVQRNFLDLFQAAHIHKIVTATPASNDGGIGDIYLGDLSSGKKLFIKFSSGWYSVDLTRV